MARDEIQLHHKSCTNGKENLTILQIWQLVVNFIYFACVYNDTLYVTPASQLGYMVKWHLIREIVKKIP